jgi:hypothetical protein
MNFSVTEIIQDNKSENVIRQIFISWCISEAKKAASSVAYYIAVYTLLLLVAKAVPYVFGNTQCNRVFRQQWAYCSSFWEST